VLDFRGAVAITHCINVIGRGDHVEIEVGTDVRGLACGERLDIIRGAQWTFFLAAPPAEADRVVDAVFRELFGDFEDSDATGAVVVDARTGSDGVGVRAEDKRGIGGTTVCCGDYIKSGAVFDNSENIYNTRDCCPAGDSIYQCSSVFLRNCNSWNIGTLFPQ